MPPSKKMEDHAEYYVELYKIEHWKIEISKLIAEYGDTPNEPDRLRLGMARLLPPPALDSSQVRGIKDLS
jgi:hypothetical protein